VFKSDSEENEELGFADAYKYEILKNREPKPKKSYKNLIISLLSIAILGTIAVASYLYINSYQSNIVEEQTKEEEPQKLPNVEELEISDINMTEGQMDEIEDTNSSSKEEESEENYIEDLAKLSDENL